MALFLAIALSIWGTLHAYIFWRLSTLPFVYQHVSPSALGITAAILWLSYFIARILDRKGLQRFVWPLEIVASNWVGVAFLLFCCFLAADMLTLGGNIFPSESTTIRTCAAALAFLLSLVGFIQGHRAPTLTDYEVALAGLPRELEGIVLVQLSDLHLGNILGKRWLGKIIARVNALKPDIIVITGDLVDGNVGRVEPLRESLQRLHAPLRVWAVSGNHEFYAGLARSIRLFENAGFNVLRDANKQAAPGLTIAGVDDLTSRTPLDPVNHPITNGLANRAPGATILLSHSPLDAGKAACAGVGLMLSGHTHNGQIWPFNYLVRSRYRLLSGRYEINGMTAIVSRGIGTWGPRMRLWLPGEIIRIKLRSTTNV
jgi:predicted MPP superfamily phosphohydrolase